jgi:predicted PurR-regulated permease PerM
MTTDQDSGQDDAFENRFTQTVIRLALLALLVFLCLRVLQPFINPIIGGVVVAIALHNPYEKLTRALGGRGSLASVVMVGLILLALILPAIALGANMVESASELSKEFNSESVKVPPPPKSVAEWPLVGEKVFGAWQAASRNLESVLVKLGPHLKDVGLWLVNTVGNLGWGLIMFIVAIVIGGALLPVREQGVATTRKVATIVAGERGPELADLVASSVQSVIRGVIGVAIIQSVLAGLGMLVVGVPGAGIWALLILILAVMQLPPTIILIPVILYVFAVESTTVAVLFMIWSVLVGFSDNVLKPLLMGRGSQTPMLVLFMGSLGGFIAGGILGLFIGAVVLSMGYTVFMAWLDDSEVSVEGGGAASASAAAARESSPESP